MYMKTSDGMERLVAGDGNESIKRSLGEPQPASRTCENRDIPNLNPGTPRTLTNRRILNCTPARVFGVADHTEVLRRAVARAVELLDNTINELTNARREVCNGATPAWPLLGDLTLCWLRRMGVCVDDIRVWTAGSIPARPTSPKTVAEVIRRLIRPRNLIASNIIRYSCGPIPSDCTPCDDKTWAFVCNGSMTPRTIIRLCQLFWKRRTSPDPALDKKLEGLHPEFQALTIIHEASHLTHDNAVERGHTIGVPECLTQLVSVSNGIPIDRTFASLCRQSRTCGPPDHCAEELAGLSAPAGGGKHALRTVFDPRRAVQLKGRLSKWIKRGAT
jgi:hypothetical protein